MSDERKPISNDTNNSSISDDIKKPTEWYIEKNSKANHTLIRGPDTIGVVGQLMRVHVVDNSSYAALLAENERLTAALNHPTSERHGHLIRERDEERARANFLVRDLQVTIEQLVLEQAINRELNEQKNIKQAQAEKYRLALEYIAREGDNSGPPYEFCVESMAEEAREALKDSK